MDTLVCIQRDINIVRNSDSNCPKIIFQEKISPPVYGQALLGHTPTNTYSSIKVNIIMNSPILIIDYVEVIGHF